MDIKTVIKAHGYTIERVALEWELKNGKTITKGALSQSINNNPTIETLQKIANVIGCKVGDFFADELGNTITCPNCGARLDITPHVEGSAAPAAESEKR